MAKGRVLGIQFDTLFTDDLYFRNGRHAIEMAEYLKEGLKARGFTFYLDSPTNQQFLVLENSTLEWLKEEAAFSVWEKPDPEHTVVRFATSWATKKESIDELFALFDARK